MTYKRRRIATLDLGTNSLLMVVAERNEEGQVTVLEEDGLLPRLGEGLRNSGKISPQAADRACADLRNFFSRARNLQADEIVVTATSAVREASNRDEFLSRVKEELDLEIEVLPPNEEARLAYISVTLERGHDDPSMVVDIGGGSTEITWGIGARFDGGRSLDLGTVKLLDGPLASERPSTSDLEKARKEIDSRLMRVTPLGKLDHYYGTAGSFTHLASVDLKLTEYHPDRVQGYRLDKETVSDWTSKLASMSVEEKLALPGIDPKRVDVIFPGTLIIERLFEKFGHDAFEVHDRGIRFGKLFDRLRTFVPPVRF